MFIFFTLKTYVLWKEDSNFQRRPRVMNIEIFTVKVAERDFSFQSSHFSCCEGDWDAQGMPSAGMFYYSVCSTAWGWDKSEWLTQQWRAGQWLKPSTQPFPNGPRWSPRQVWKISIMDVSLIWKPSCQPVLTRHRNSQRKDVHMWLVWMSSPGAGETAQ